MFMLAPPHANCSHCSVLAKGPFRMRPPSRGEHRRGLNQSPRLTWLGQSREATRLVEARLDPRLMASGT